MNYFLGICGLEGQNQTMLPSSEHKLKRYCTGNWTSKLKNLEIKGLQSLDNVQCNRLGYHWSSHTFAHPHKPRSQHMVSETLAIQPELNTLSCGGGMTLSANHSSCILFTNAFDSVSILVGFWKANPHAGRLSANHVSFFMCSGWVVSSSTQ